MHHNYAFDYVETIIAMSSGNDVYVVIEDARLRKWYGDKSNVKAQGAGAIKAICGFWEEWSKNITTKRLHINFIHPIKGGTKINARQFKLLTSYEGSTNEHSRDAGVVAFTYNPAITTALKPS